MSKKMLIDATHVEETRVAIIDNTRLVEFDTESIHRKLLKGNIYLARIVRVEPSLQAAFVEYGGNRQGFLAFNDIHPDYYQIPVEDRQKLMEESQSSVKEEDEPEEEPSDKKVEELSEGAEIHTINDDQEEVGAQRINVVKRYRIQEVIKNRQVLLVQVVREARGNKGAALTTYLSLAGRYCVLMPNAGHNGGGVSRKITDATVRRKLKSVLEGLEMPEGFGVIVRTAGLGRSKTEIKRDYEYLLRVWENIREQTVKSVAPSMIYEESELIKRAIRDLYGREVDEILIEGEEGYKTAKNFMRILMPSHAKKVQPYRESNMPLFHKHDVEEQLQATHLPTVHLPSGGSIVISPTEALVSIDVNSGKATRERNIEETAYKTNCEAAEEIARQLRLRDLGGLIVIDFIDMHDSRHKATVERRFKEAVKDDRARIQIGRISLFGLLEMSRQRLRPSVTESLSERCPHCNGAGVIRSTESMALRVLRQIESEGIKGILKNIKITLTPSLAIYLLNHKRDMISQLEIKYQLRVLIVADDRIHTQDIQVDHHHEPMQPKAALVTTEKEEIKREVKPEPLKREPLDKEGEGQPQKMNKQRNRRRDRNRPRKDMPEGIEGSLETATKIHATPIAELAVTDKVEPVDTTQKPETTPKNLQRVRYPQRRRQQHTQPAVSVEGIEASSVNEGVAVKTQSAEPQGEAAAPQEKNSKGNFDRNNRFPQRGVRRERPQREPGEMRKSPKIIIESLVPVMAQAQGPASASSSVAQVPVVVSEPPKNPKKGWWQKNS
jgi:ribonuclease E